MFLDEKLLKIGRETELDKESILDAISKMIVACFDNITSNITETSSISAVKSTFNRVNKTWIKVARQLEKEGRGFLKEDGFDLIVRNKPEFEGIFN